MTTNKKKVVRLRKHNDELLERFLAAPREPATFTYFRLGKELWRIDRKAVLA